MDTSPSQDEQREDDKGIGPVEGDSDDPHNSGAAYWFGFLRKCLNTNRLVCIRISRVSMRAFYLEAPSVPGSGDRFGFPLPTGALAAPDQCPDVSAKPFDV